MGNRITKRNVFCGNILIPQKTFGTKGALTNEIINMAKKKRLFETLEILKNITVYYKLPQWKKG
jgi:hypothetical protein